MLGIKTTKDILKGYDEEKDEEGIYDEEKWVRVSKIRERINHILDIIKDCSFEDDFGKPCIEYSDLNNQFKILNKELEWKISLELKKEMDTHLEETIRKKEDEYVRN